MVSVSKVQYALLVLAVACNGVLCAAWFLTTSRVWPGAIGGALATALPALPLLAGRRARRFVALALAVAVLLVAGWLVSWVESDLTEALFSFSVLSTPGAIVLLAAAIAPREVWGARDAAGTRCLGLGVAAVVLLVCLAGLGVMATLALMLGDAE